MESIKRVLKQNILRSAKPRLFGASLVVGMWEKALVEVEGQVALSKTRAISFRDGVLKINAYSDPWALEVRIKQEIIVKTLNEKLNTSLVKSLKIESRKG